MNAEEKVARQRLSVLQLAETLGSVRGVAGSASLARRYAALGFRFITVQSDTALLLEAARSSIRAARSTE